MLSTSTRGVNPVLPVLRKTDSRRTGGEWGLGELGEWGEPRLPLLLLLLLVRRHIEVRTCCGVVLWEPG